MDLRLVGSAATDAPTKAEVAAEHIAGIWSERRLRTSLLNAGVMPHLPEV